MKKSLYSRIISGIMVLTCFSSCKDYLDFEYIFNQDITLDSVFMQKQYTEQWLADTYRGLIEGGNVPVESKGRMPVNFLGDDLYYSDWEARTESYINMKTVKYTENSTEYPDNWFKCFNVIRKAAIFIHNVDKNQEMTPEEILDNKGQARFLRAYMYWTLLRKYGPIMILPDEGADYKQHYDDLVMSRNTYEECAEYIASEMAIAAQEMSDRPRSSREIARATPGAALAVRARAYLYAASPLFNGNQDDWAKQLTDDEGKPLLNLERKEILWAKAAAAAKEVMDLGLYNLHTTGIRERDESLAYPKTVIPPYHAEYSNKAFPEGWADIDPLESYRSVFNGELSAENNKELIFTRGANRYQEGESILDMVLHQVPYHLNGWNSHGATMKQANTYYMNNGADHYAYGFDDPSLAVKPDSLKGYTGPDDNIPHLRENVSREFGYREPRYYASIAFNGCFWECSDAPNDYVEVGRRQAFYYQDNSNGMASADNEHYLKTGIGVKKFYHPRDYFTSRNMKSGQTRPKADIDIRYAEVLLIYAEALNELSEPHTVSNYIGDGTITVSRDINEMRKGMKPVRMRGGIPDLLDNIYADQTAFRKALKRERQIELFAENHRYHDLRRWKDVDEEERKPVYGYNMRMTEAQRDLWHIPVQVPSLPNLFVEKTYLWPIKHDELRKNPKLTQNPGWTYYY